MSEADDAKVLMEGTLRGVPAGRLRDVTQGARPGVVVQDAPRAAPFRIHLRYITMGRDDVARSELEQATLRVRLAATALGATLLMLAPAVDQAAAAVVLLAYLAVSLALRAFGARLITGIPAILGSASDILFAGALSVVLPQAPAWPVYAFAIGAAAVRHGHLGAAAATAAAVVVYDAVLIARSGGALAVDLWPVQVLLGFGLLAAELVWVALREQRGHARARAYSLAQRDCAAAADEQQLLARLADHAVRTFGASGASIEVERDGTRRAVVTRGASRSGEQADRQELPLAPDTFLRASFSAAEATVGVATLRDLAADVSPLLAATRDRETQRRERDVGQGILAAIGRVEREITVAGVLAEVAVAAGALAGPSAIVRLADGARLAGDLDAEVAVAVGREVAPPRLVLDVPSRSPGAIAETAAVVSAGRGLALVSIGTQRDLTEHDLASLALLGEVAWSVSGRIAHHDTLTAIAAEFRIRSEELAGQLRDRDDAVASAVHELRNPLASVRAYGQLMSRHLGSVQRQVLQLDSLIEDLLHLPAGSSPRPLALETMDLSREATEAAARIRVSQPDTAIRVITDPDAGPSGARIDAIRFAQVLDNVLGNAVKFSPRGTPIEVRVKRHLGDVVVAVSDRGDGILPEDLERIFERHARAARHAGTVPGAGIGLAIAREIVLAHGGRMWAESAGPGRGSTITIALPVAETAAPDAPAPEGASTG